MKTRVVPIMMMLISMMQPSTGKSQFLTAEARSGAPVARVQGQRVNSALFIQNDGQFDPRVRFQMRGAGGVWWFTDDGIWLTVMRGTEGTEGTQRTPSLSPCPLVPSSPCPLVPLSGVALQLTFPGLSPAAHLVGSDPRPSEMNYFQGNNPSKWRWNVPTFGSLVWRDVYPGVDLVVSDQWSVVSHYPLPTTHYSLHLHIDGADRLHIDEHGRLVAETAIGPLTLPEMTTADGQRQSAIVAGNEVTFAANLQSPISNLQSLISPSDDLTGLMYSTFLGGSGPIYFGANDGSSGITVDAAGQAVVVGRTTSPDFPTTPGVFEQDYDGGLDCFISKFNAEGTALLFSTFLAGSDSDGCGAVTLGADGTVYVTGNTASADFPTTPGAFDTTFNGLGDGSRDVFAVKLSADGTDLLFGTYLGGSSPTGEYGNAIAVDAGASVYIAGVTTSSDFPTSAGAYDRVYHGSQDAFISVLNAAGSALNYSTFLGGGLIDSAAGIALQPDGQVTVTGSTSSSDFPTTPETLDPFCDDGVACSNDAFVTRLNASGSALVFSTFLGGTLSDAGNAVAVDASGSTYVTGSAHSSDFPTTAGAYDPSWNGYPDVFVSKLSPDGSRFVYSTYLGGSHENGGDEGLALAIDSNGRAYVGGRTVSPDFPTTAGAVQRDAHGGREVFVSQLASTGSVLLYSSYLGGSLNDNAWGLAIDSVGDAYLTGDTISHDFPVSPRAFDTTPHGDQDAFVSKFNLVLSAGRTRVRDSGPGGNHNGYPDPGETGLRLSQSLHNSGLVPLTGVTARLTALSPGVTVNTRTASYPEIQPGRSASNQTPFQISLASDLACGTSLQFQLQVVTDQRNYTVSFELITGAPQPAMPVFGNDVEHGRQGWTTGGLYDQWGITGTLAHSPQHAWMDSLDGDYQNRSNSWLQTPELDLSHKTGLTYSAWYTNSLELGNDNVYLEYSLDGGLTWAATPLAVFTGATDTWVQRSTDVTVLADQPHARLRYRLYTNSSVTGPGIAIDDMVLRYTPYECTPP